MLMLDPHLLESMSFGVTAAVQFQDGEPGDPGNLCRIHHCGGHIDAWTWLPRTRKSYGAFIPGRAVVLKLSDEPPQFALVDMEGPSEVKLAELLADDLCPIAGVVRQTAQLIDGLKSRALRNLMAEAMLDYQAFTGYWTSPASRNHHHAYPGGLALHSLEVATMMATADRLTDTDRELGICAALLHDYGKIWCYGAVGQSQDSRGHEHIGLKRLSHALGQLHDEDDGYWEELLELLGGPRAHPRDQYPLALGRVLNAFDQYSCETDRRAAREASVPEQYDPF